MELLWSMPASQLQSYLVLLLSALTSAYITVARPTILHIEHHDPEDLDHHEPQPGEARANGEGGKGAEAPHPHQREKCPPATLYEAGTSGLVPTAALLAYRALMAAYIGGMGANQLRNMGTYCLKFYTIWNWWLLAAYFTLAALASWTCLCAERAESSRGPNRQPPTANGKAAASANGGDGGAEGSAARLPPAPLRAATGLSRWCHALFMTNSATVIIVDAVCWGVLYPMLKNGPQSAETQRIIQRLLLSYTSYNQHGFNALFIFTDLFLNRHRLAFHAVGPLGLWSLAYGAWAHVWHAISGRWLYPFLDTSKPWAPVAYFGLYVVHWAAFGLVALLFKAKAALYRRRRRGAAGAELKSKAE
ncbi:hypothetical protein HYH03_017273 [Edaphochlamys debaryana]|uniref:Uncharacterized protein n=1 Tax=Edaphochlamys debaryana TaxID=47281 RepID=A0A836BQL0_9CHLO|nr:hypothetical protein HYH03_017273 [Edaphochlamys debaryana]|eukprot:KAG2483879.1 hypothetical protein HYH03_017273 [Edaphochlamys debaryana]